MTDQERLEYIKILHDEANEIGKNGAKDSDKKIYAILSRLFYQAHTDWLIAQAERFETLSNIHDQTLAENQRYKQALVFYADEDIYTVQDGERIKGIFTDQGEKARQALKGDTNA